MSPMERLWRINAEEMRARAQEAAWKAKAWDYHADLVALEDLSLAEVESLQRLCRGEG